MDWNDIESNWEQMKGKVLETWGKLTSNDIDIVKGKKQQLVGKLKEKYGYASDKAEAEIDRFLSTCKDSCSSSSKKGSMDNDSSHAR